MYCDARNANPKEQEGNVASQLKNIPKIGLHVLLCPDTSKNKKNPE